MSENLGLFGWGNEFNKVKCPDGTIRFVLKKVSNMGKAFSLWLPDVNHKLTVSLKAAQQAVEGSIDAEAGSKAEQVLKDIDSLHIDAVTKFSAAYIAYMGSPCDKIAYDNLGRTVKDIGKSLDKLRKLETEMNKLNEKKLGASDASQAALNISKVITGLRQYYK